MLANNSKDLVERIEEWAHSIGINLDHDPDQIE